jgi:curli biogenesis system outer membrane secretion channel CsgG
MCFLRIVSMIKPRRIIFLLIFCLSFFGCVAPQVTTYNNPDYKKPGTDFALYRKIAVLNFECANTAIGQEVSDIFAFSLRKKGYDVIDRSRIKAIIDEAMLSQSGLTDSNLTLLKLRGANSVLVGSVTRYDCEQSRMLIPTRMGPIGGSKNLCQVSLSIKMLDVSNGDIIWATQGAYSGKGKNLTAAQALKYVIDEIEPQIP